MLAELLKKLLATEFAMYLKAQHFHWNVEGPDFGELHSFFGSIYQDIYGAIDPTAEYIRTLDEYAPGSMERFLELSTISGQLKIPRAKLMIEELLSDNQTMISLLNETFAAAEQENQQGVANFVAERLDAHGKHGWQLRSYLKEQRA